MKIIKAIEKISNDEGVGKDVAASRLDERRAQNGWSMDRLQKEFTKRDVLDIMQGLDYE